MWRTAGAVAPSTRLSQPRRGDMMTGAGCRCSAGRRCNPSWRVGTWAPSQCRDAVGKVVGMGGLPYDAAPYLTPLACLYVDATILYSHPRFIVTLSFLGILLKIRLKPLPIDGAASRCWCQRLRQASTSPLVSMSSRRRLALPPASPDRGSHAAKPRSKSRHPASMPAFFFVIVFSLQFRTTGVRTKNASLHVVHGHPCPVPSISVRRIATSG